MCLMETNKCSTTINGVPLSLPLIIATLLYSCRQVIKQKAQFYAHLTITDHLCIESQKQL